LQGWGYADMPKKAIDPAGTDQYVLHRDSDLEHSTAWKRAAAERCGGRVLIHGKDFRDPTADKAVGFFVARIPAPLLKTGNTKMT
jgi:hypothetical protein